MNKITEIASSVQQRWSNTRPEYTTPRAISGGLNTLPASTRSYYIGREYKRDYERQPLFVSQTACCDRLAQRFGVTTTSPIPAVSTVALSPRQEEKEKCKQPYRDLLGGLMCIVNATRPDTSKAVREVARHAHDPSVQYWRTALKVVQYLKGTREKGITYVKSPSSQLEAYAEQAFGIRGRSLVFWWSSILVQQDSTLCNAGHD